jgi:hypothetical protein
MNVFEFIKSWTVVKFGENRIRFIEAVYLKYLFFIFYTKKNMLAFILLTANSLYIQSDQKENKSSRRCK